MPSAAQADETPRSLPMFGPIRSLSALFDLNENALERSKTNILLVLIAISIAGEIALITIDLLRGGNVTNNVIVLGFVVAALILLSRGYKTLAVYLTISPFIVDFFRSYFTSGGVDTHAMPLFFLLLMEAIYLLPLRHALVVVSLMLIAFNLDAPLALSEQLTSQERMEAASDTGRRLVVANAIAIAITAIFATVFFNLNRYFRELQFQNEHLDELVQIRTEELNQERQRSEILLLNILPSSIAERLKRQESEIVDEFPSASVLFADFVGFTPFAASVPANRLVAILNQRFSAIDDLVEQYGLEKIKTIGDAYMVASGLPEPSHDHIDRLARFALDLQALMGELSDRDGLDLELRIGIHTGPVIAGVIGRKRFVYDLWGETVNTASRLESSGAAGRIHVTKAVRQALGEGYCFSARRQVELKGVGLTETYFLEQRDDRDIAAGSH